MRSPDNRIGVRRIARVDDAADDVVAIGVGVVGVVERGDEAVAEQAGDVALVLVAGGTRADHDGVAFGRHGDRNAGDRVERHLHVLCHHVSIGAVRLLPADDQIRAVLAADASGLEVEVGGTDARWQLEQLERVGHAE